MNKDSYSNYKNLDNKNFFGINFLIGSNPINSEFKES